MSRKKHFARSGGPMVKEITNLFSYQVNRWQSEALHALQGLHPTETRKVVKRFINYMVYKGAFLPLIVPPTVAQEALWSTWLTVLCTLKMFQTLGRDRLEQLNASPSATPWTYFDVFSVLLVVLSVDVFWLRLYIVIYKALGSTMFLLLFFEPLSVAFETVHVLLQVNFIFLLHS